ncbi:uncharacterized protein [Clytia hemisphaerica]|uniref:Uncharacterized protein n=1 Tax=Clytia hemisphaerica TaxID=252671 RepID=A0A7M5UYY6_9CNID
MSAKSFYAKHHIWIFVTVWLALITEPAAPKRIVISKRISADDYNDCGTIEKPCRTLNFAIKYQSSDGDILLLDGGCGSYEYEISQTEPIVIDKEITLTSLETAQECNYAMITTRNNYDGIFCQVQKNLNVSFIRFNPIEMGSPTLFEFNGSMLLVNDCIIKYFEKAIIVFEQVSDSYAKFERCRFTDIECRVGDHVFSKRTTDNGNVLTMIDCVMDNMSFGVDSCFTGTQKMEVVKSNITDSDITSTVTPELSVNISDSRIMGTSAVFIYGDNIIFTNIYLEESTIQIINTYQVQISGLSLKSETVQYTPISLHNIVNNVSINGQISISSPGSVEIDITSYLDLKSQIVYEKSAPQNISIQHYFNNSGSGSIKFDRQGDSYVTEIYDFLGLLGTRPSQYDINCFGNYQASFVKDNHLLAVICSPLSRQYYSLAESKVYLNETNQKFSTSQNTQIQKCPFEAHCGDGRISNKEPYWGMVNDNISFVNSYGDSVYGSSMAFFPCPELYCCPINEDCNGGFDSCSRGRKGNLCGDCKDGFVVPIIGHGCMPELDCDVITFVAVFFLLTPVWLLMVKYARVVIEKVLLIGKRLRAGVDAGRRNPEPDRNQAQEHDEHIGYILDEPCGDGGRMSPIVGQPPNRPINEKDDVDIFIVSLMEIVFVFYQVAYTMRVKTAQRIKHQESLIVDILTIPFTGSIDATPSANQYCAALTRDAFAIEAIKIGPLFFSFCILLAAIALFQMKEWIGKFRRRVNNGEREPLLRYQQLDQNTPNYDGRRKPLDLQLSEWYLNFMFIAYLPFALFLLKIINCWSGFTDESLSYLQSSVSCFSRPCQAIALFVFIFIWVPVPLAVYFATKLLRACKINSSQFLVALTFPPSIIWYSVKRENGEGLTRKQISFTYHFLQIIDGGYRKWKPEENQPMQWKPALITRALIIAVIININDPFVRLTTFCLVFLIFIIFESTMKPYKDKTLNTLSINSWVLLMMLAIFNIFWLFTGINDVEKSDVLSFIGYLLLVCEIILLLLPFLSVIFYILGCLVYRTVQKYLMKKQN